MQSSIRLCPSGQHSTCSLSLAEARVVEAGKSETKTSLSSPWVRDRFLKRRVQSVNRKASDSSENHGIVQEFKIVPRNGLEIAE